MKHLVVVTLLLSHAVFAADAGLEARLGRAAQENSEAQHRELNARLNRLLNACTSVYYPDYGKVADLRSAQKRKVKLSGMRMDTAFGWTGLVGERPRGSERFSVTFDFIDPDGHSQKFTQCLFQISKGSDPRLKIKDCNYPTGYKGPKEFQCGYGQSSTRKDPCSRGFCGDRSVSSQIDKAIPSGRKVSGPQGVGN